MSFGNCSGSGTESKGIAGTCAAALLHPRNTTMNARLVLRSPLRFRPAGFVDRDGGTLPDAHDLYDHFLVLRTVPVDLVRVMHHDTACRHRRGGVLVELRAGADPPGALDHRDVARLRMEMRRAEGVRGEAVAHDIGLAGRGRAAPDDGVGRAR